MQILVTGAVVFFHPSSDPALPADKQVLPPMGPTELKKFKDKADNERLPRAFHASFVLVPEETAEGVKVCPSRLCVGSCCCAVRTSAQGRPHARLDSRRPRC